MATLLVAEIDNGRLSDLAPARSPPRPSSAQPVDILVAGENVGEPPRRRRSSPGCAKVLRRRRRGLRPRLAEPLAALLVALAPGYDAIVAASTRLRQERDAARRGAARRHADLRHHQGRRAEDLRAADLRRQRAPDGASRPTPRWSSRCAPPPSPATGEGGSAAIETVARGGRSRPLALRRRSAGQVRPAGADVGQDRHLRRPRHAEGGEFQALIEPVADKLGAAVGASRAAVDAGYVPND